MKQLPGRIKEVEPYLEAQRLKVRLGVLTEEEDLEGGPFLREVFLPQREIAALLPRSLLAGDNRQVPKELLETIAPILARLVTGRAVRLWSYESRAYASFLSWRGVRFTD
jgi:hypothetical protein